ncbi:MAG: nuclear transport factor 2 family protein [Acidimicrobiales bacterium]
MSESDANLLRRLADESALRELIHAYAFGLDHQDWELWRSIFLDEVVIDMTDVEPEPLPRLLPVEKHVRAVERMFARFDATQHFIGSHRYAIDGDHAVITAHMRAEHWLTSDRGGDKYTMFGTYIDEAVRTPDGWKLAKVKLSLIRQEGNRDIMRMASRRPHPDQRSN